jgi:hypothetical protein
MRPKLWGDPSTVQPRATRETDGDDRTNALLAVHRSCVSVGPLNVSHLCSHRVVVMTADVLHRARLRPAILQPAASFNMVLQLLARAG